MFLDTCAVLWLAFSRDNISKATLDKIEHSPSVRISSLSFWEIGIKAGKGKLQLPITVEELISLYQENSRTEIIAPSADIILTALKLEWEHKDPVDRIIVASAIKHRDTIVSGDTIIARFYKDTVI